MNRLRLNRRTGRLAERIPADAVVDGRTWLAWHWGADGLAVESSPTRTSRTGPRSSSPRARPPAPEYVSAVACVHCDGSLAASVHERDRLAEAEHEGHDTAPYAVRVRHPRHADDATLPTFAPGTPVTFHGSTTGQAPDLLIATIDHAEQRDVDGDPTDGYVVAVQGKRLFVPATAVRIA